MKRLVCVLVLLSGVLSYAQTNRSTLSPDSRDTIKAVKKPALNDVSLVCWTNGLGHNGHWYEAVCVGPDGISWDGAKAVADVKGGYLATLTSKEENDFVFHLIDNPKFWFTQWKYFMAHGLADIVMQRQPTQLLDGNGLVNMTHSFMQTGRFMNSGAHLSPITGAERNDVFSSTGTNRPRLTAGTMQRMTYPLEDS